MLTDNQLKYLQKSGLQPSQIAQVVKSMGGYDKSTAPKTASGFMGNIVKSGVNTVGQIGSALINTVNPDMEKNTIANLGKLAIGTLQYIDPTQALGTKYEKNAKAVGQFYLDRYGSLDKAMNTFYNDPVGMALDVASVLSGVGGIAKGGAVGAAKLGELGTAAKLGKVGNAFSKAASFTDPLSLIGKKVGKVTSGTRAKLISGLDKAGENIVTRGIGNPAAQAKAAQKAGRSVSSFIDEYNLYDRSPETARTVKRSILNQYDDLAMNSGKSIQMAQIIKSFNDEIDRLRGGMNGVVSDANQAKIAELTRRRDQLLQAAGGMVDENGRLISSPISTRVDTLTNFRRNVIDPDVPQSMFNLDARGSGAAQGVKQARDIVKAGIDSTDPRLSKLGKDYGMAKSVEKIFDQSAARGQNRQVFNFTKLGGAGLGGIVAGAPTAVGGFVAESVVNNPRFIAGASKTMKAGSKLLKSPRIPNLTNKMGRVITPSYNYARMGRMVNVSPVQKKPISTSIETQQQNQSTQQRLSPSQSSYTPMPKLPPIQVPKKSAQAFGGNVKVKRGSFY